MEKVKFGEFVTISDDHCTNLSLFFTNVKKEPKIGYDFGGFGELFLEVVLDLVKMNRERGISINKMSVVEMVKSIFYEKLGMNWN